MKQNFPIRSEFDLASIEIILLNRRRKKNLPELPNFSTSFGEITSHLTLKICKSYRQVLR